MSLNINWGKFFAQFGLLKIVKREAVADQDQIILNKVSNSGNNQHSEQYRILWSEVKEEMTEIASGVSGNTVFDAVDPLFVTDVTNLGIRTITYSNVLYTPPTISLSGNSIFEVGSSNNGLWNAEFVQGRDTITLRTVTSTDGSADAIPGDLTVPFVLTSTNTTSVVRATVNVFTLDVNDGTTPIQDIANMTFYNKTFFFYSTKDGVGQPILEADIEAGVGIIENNIFTTYGGTNTYNIPAGPNVYLYWCYENGTSEINNITEGPLPVPIKTDLSTVGITNIEGVGVTYRTVRTQNALATATKNLTIT